MKARKRAGDILQRYAAGERDFCNVNLQGANFKGQDLSGANFSGADIRSANFVNTKLHGSSFIGVRAGLQRWRTVMQLLLIAMLSAVTGILQGFTAVLLAYFFDYENFDSSQEQLFGAAAYFLIVIVVYVVISLKGFSIRAFSLILTAVGFVFVVAFLFVIAVPGMASLVAASSFAVAISGIFTVAVAGTGAFAVIVAGSIIGVLTVASAFVISVIVIHAFSVEISVAVAFSIIGLLFGILINFRVYREDDKFQALREFGLLLAALGGTSFCGADLTGATFHRACLIKTSFASSTQHKTILTHVCWQGARNLSQSRLGSTILKDRRVRTLLTTPERGYKKDLTDANLRGAYLKGATLEGAILRRAILTDAFLKKRF